MRIPRFYTTEDLHIGQRIALSLDYAQHAQRVLRLRIGDVVAVFNGDGHDYHGPIVLQNRTTLNIQIEACLPIDTEPRLDITLLQAISSGDRMDWTIQKAVELGVKSIQAISSELSVVRLSAERSASRMRHWQGIVLSACAQCGRARIPTLYAPCTLADYLHSHPHDVKQTRLLLQPSATHTARTMVQPQETIVLLVGAESGLSADEEHLAIAHNFIPVRLGPRILRTETAGLAMISALQALWGDFV